jgi:outer membrane protein assembly factor BamB
LGDALRPPVFQRRVMMRGARGLRRRAYLLAAASAAIAACWAGVTGPAAATVAAQAGGPDSWTVYHGDPAGSGVARSVPGVDTSARAWTSPALDGQLYGEPLVSGGRVFVATENDTVYALSAGSGAIVWSKHLATPVPTGSLPCGDISPAVGITGTPVIDEDRGEIFVVADEVVNQRPAHVLVGLSTSNGRVELTTNVDPPGADPAALLQRTGLTLAGGRVIFGFGGNFGDCASYRGRVVAAPETGGQPAMFTVDSAADQSQGAIWMGGGAPAVDQSGHVFVTAGNGSVHDPGQPYDHSDSVLELTPSMHLVQFFAPRSWATDNAQDLDMSIEPVLLPSGQVLLAGKSRIAYLLSGTHLGGIGGEQAALHDVCGSDIDGGAAVQGSTVYLPCVSGVTAVRVATSPPGLRALWSSRSAGGPPIVAAGLVWTIGQDGILYGLDPGTGQVRQQASIGRPANHFPTPSVAAGLLLATSANQVVAFHTRAGGNSGSASPPVSGSPSGSSSATVTPAISPSAAAGSDGLAPGAIASIVLGAVVILGGIGWVLWRRFNQPGP